MKDLIKIMLVLALVFASTFVIIKATGLLSLDDIKGFLEQSGQIHLAYLSLIIIGLLFADLFIAVPTMTVSIFAGYFLGWPLGAVSTIGGFYLAGITGYIISHKYGWRLLHFIYKDWKRISEMQRIFTLYGSMVLIICRAIPILPEVSCCMAGATHMRFSRFIAMYTLGSVPYALITTYVGSISTFEKPLPAIFTAMGISLGLWLAWFILGRRLRNAEQRC